MLREQITYTDYNGRERTESFYFHLSLAEMAEMDLKKMSDILDKLNGDANDLDATEIMKLFKYLILAAYGEKSPDGKRFIKSEERRTAFSQSEAYSTLFMELLENPDKANKFFQGILPESLLANAAASAA